MKIPQISPSETKQKLDAGAPNLILLDCREHDELALARIAGSTHIPMNDIPARLAELDRSAEIIVICHSGRRSQYVAAFLVEQGFANVMNLAGGIDAWSREIDPAIPRY